MITSFFNIPKHFSQFPDGPQYLVEGIQNDRVVASAIIAQNREQWQARIFSNDGKTLKQFSGLVHMEQALSECRQHPLFANCNIKITA